jgi:cation-transporting P-type ATPase C
MFWHRKQPLTHCEIRHRLPGRIRIGCRALRYLPEQSGDLAERLRRIDGIDEVGVSCLTANVLIHHDRDRLSNEDVFELVEGVISAFSLDAYKALRAEQAELTVQERRLQEEPVGELVGRVLSSSVSLVFSWLRRGSATPPTSFLGRFVTMPALTSLSLAVPIFKSGFSSLRDTMRPNADTLSASAILASILAGRDVSALTIIWLADIAELLTAWTMDRTRKAIREMLAVGEEMVWRRREDGTDEQVPLDQLEVDDQVMAHTGEKISVDGVVVEGEAAVDQASITGEYMPQRKTAGDEVYAGTVVKSGKLLIRAHKVGDETAVARIVHMVEEATHRKATIQAFADRFSAQFIPANFALALIVLLITGKTSRALNMLIIDYSCGVRLSTATAMSAAICAAARHGILVKGSNYLELLAEADTLVLDKTGTMTEGRPRLTDIIALQEGFNRRAVVELAAAAEETSRHPMALAILDKVRRSGWRIPKHTENETVMARGVSSKVGRSIVRVGSRRFMLDNRIDVAVAEDDVMRLARRGDNILYVARGKKLIGVLGVQDTLRENMKKSLNRLRQSGMDDIILLTGDVEQHAEIVASRMAMDRFEAEVLPDDKAETILKLQQKGTRVVMVGDGINDAPALAYADVGIAMGGTRTDVAMQAADITITNDDPLMIPAIIRLAQGTMSIVRQNFATAIGVNTLGLVLGSLGVLPVFWGAVLHNATTVAVVLNSSRLLLRDVERER